MTSLDMVRRGEAGGLGGSLNGSESEVGRENARRRRET